METDNGLKCIRFFREWSDHG